MDEPTKERAFRRWTAAACILAAATAAATASACGDDLTAPDIRSLEFAPELGVDIDTFTETESGLFYKDEVVGEGAPVGEGWEVSFAITGWLINGDVIQARQVFDVQAIGSSSLIPGVEEGLVGMRVGGERKLVVPPALAYGSRGQGPIPPNAVLVFLVELLEATPPE